jgi:hypothetical protein
VHGLVEAQFDFGPITSYYNGFYGIDSQLGARPESTALVPPLNAPATNWTSAHKLSGNAAIGWNFLFDKDGKRYASGVPVTGAIWDGNYVYDPRLDSTRPGGSGSCRLGNESTYVFSRTPALYAGTYAHGYYDNGERIMGIGVPADGIDWQAIAAWANDCETNEWEASGVIFEGGPDAGPGQRKRNLADICAAGAGRWLMAGAVLSFDWQRPRVPLATFTDSDIDEDGGDLVTLQSFRDRFNVVRPQYTDPDSNWQQITAEPIAGTTYVTEDGQRKVRAWPLNLVAKADQAGQIATYAMADSREVGPITLTFGPEWREYRPGDCLRWESEETGFEGDLVIVSRSFDPATLKVTFTFKGETAGKHDFALGKVAVPPPTAIIGQTGEQRDAVATQTINPRAALTIRQFTPPNTVVPGNGQVEIGAFQGLLDDGRTIDFPAETITGLDTLELYRLLWDLITEEYVAVLGTAVMERQDSRYVDVAAFYTSDGTAFPPPPTDPPDGWFPPGSPGAELP